MYPLIFTLSFLFLLGFTQIGEWSNLRFEQRILNWEEREQEADYQVREALLHTQLEKAKSSLQFESKGKKRGEKKKEITHRKKAYPLHFDETRPPNNSRLNIFLALNKEKDRSAFSAYEITAKLIRLLYRDTSYYSEGLEYWLLDHLSLQKEQWLNFTSVDELAQLDLESDEKQCAWVKMLKGAEERPSLLWYLTWKRDEGKSQINLLFCPQELLLAIFNDEALVSELELFQNSMLRKLNYQEEHLKDQNFEDPETRSKIRLEAEARFKETLQKAGLSPESFGELFDFSLGQIGETFYLKDPQTGFRRRERLL